MVNENTVKNRDVASMQPGIETSNENATMEVDFGPVRLGFGLTPVSERPGSVIYNEAGSRKLECVRGLGFNSDAKRATSDDYQENHDRLNLHSSRSKRFSSALHPPRFSRSPVATSAVF